MWKKIQLVFMVIVCALRLNAQCDNDKPMYGVNCVKTPEMIKTDQEFIKTSVKQYVTLDSAAMVYLRFGFRHLVLQNDPATAIKRFNQSWLLDSSAANVYFVFGLFTEFILDANKNEASFFYQRGKDLDSNHESEVNTYYAFLEYFERKKDTQICIELCSRAIKLDPKNRYGFFYKKRGYYNLVMKNYEQGESDFDAAILIDSMDANTHYNKAVLYKELNRMEEAKALVEKVIFKDDTHLAAMVWLFTYYREYSKNTDEALKILNKMLAVREFPDVYARKAEVLFELNKNKEACNCLKKSIDLGMNDSKKLFNQKCK